MKQFDKIILGEIQLNQSLINLLIIATSTHLKYIENNHHILVVYSPFLEIL